MENKIKNYVRVEPPKFKIGRRVLNEYELRYLQYSICNGDIEGNIKVYSDRDKTWHVIDNNGMFDITPNAYSLLSGITLSLVYLKRQKNNTVDSQ